MTANPGGCARSAWLQAAVTHLDLDVFDPAGISIPEVNVTARLPLPWRRLGQARITLDQSQVPQIDIAPSIKSGPYALAVLTHELIHAACGPHETHGATFTRHARRVGLEGKMTSTKPGPELAATLAVIANRLGPYPGPPPPPAIPPRWTRQTSTKRRDAWCDPCRYLIRIDTLMALRGIPACPLCGDTLTVDEFHGAVQLALETETP